MRINLIFILIILTILNTKVFSQQDNTLYYMKYIPQSNLSNPANQCNCTLNLSGALIPTTGSLYFNLSNSGFVYTDLIHNGTGLQSDSLIADIPNVLKKTQKINYLTSEYFIDWFTAGYKYKDYYFTFNITEKFDIKIGYPRDLIKLFWEGNGKSFLGNTIGFTGIGLSANYYREYAFGISKKINKKLTFGIKPKLLFGKANINTKKNNITWETYSNNFGYKIKTDIEVNTSQPFADITDFYFDFDNYTIIVETKAKKPTVKHVVMNNNNFGLGLDIGFVYKLYSNVTFYGSIIDLGYIRWKENVTTFKMKGQYWPDGLNIIPMLQNSDTINDSYINNCADSVIRLYYDPHLQKKYYYSYLTAKLYLGGQYSLNDKLNFGLLTRMEFLLHTIRPSVSLSVNSNLKKWFSTSISYSIINNSFKNVGLGIMLKPGPFQFYVVTDNIMSAILPLSTKNINIRAGINMIFGCPKHNGKTYL